MKAWQDLLSSGSVAQAIFVISLAVIGGLALGSLKVRGVGLGIAGVLFSGLLFGHLGFRINPEILEFAREFGLILFVYTIGLQVGPGFPEAFKKDGLPLNFLVAGIVFSGAFLAFGLSRWLGIPMDVGAGIFAGATTNTPALGAVQQAISSQAGKGWDPGMPGLGYAVSYPFGIVGIIAAMLVLRWVFRPPAEPESAADARTALHNAHLRVKNPDLDGIALGKIPGLEAARVVVSRLGREGSVRVARPEDRLRLDDVLLAVGPAEGLEQARRIIGEATDVDLRETEGPLGSQRILVTRRGVLGKSASDLGLLARFGATVTRLRRGEVEISAAEGLKFQFGDQVTAVGEANGLRLLAAELGNSVKDLNHPSLIPVFIGIGLGLMIGVLPVPLPGVPAPVKLGLAGGPLVAAMILSRIGHIGPLVWHIPENANFLLRGLGITLFLACVGLKGGEHFAESLAGGSGWLWMGAGAAVTLLPLLVFGGLACLFLKAGQARLCGLLAGSMTDPPALAFAQAVCRSDGPAVAYATVYPLAMVLRILAAQLLVLMG
jgi:putative transport protein